MEEKEILEKLLQSYKYNDLINEGRGMIYAENYAYYIRIKVDEWTQKRLRLRENRLYL